MSPLKITPEDLARRALVYVRPSSPPQERHNLESPRRQAALVHPGRPLGFTVVETSDEDGGCSAAGPKQRPGFERLVAEIGSGEVGAVLGLEASRLVRKGRGGPMVSNAESGYDPRRSNARLRLGRKGTRNEYELSWLPQRTPEAIRQKGQRGELRFWLPAGLTGTVAGENRACRRSGKPPSHREDMTVMMGPIKITPEHLARRALVYVRPSSPPQERHNLESPRRQYELAQQARQLGFTVVETIDEDGGCSAAGQKQRLGFERLVAEVCSGEVGAVLGLEASRLVRKGRGGPMVSDAESGYDPRRSNAGLRLGRKGTRNEYELSWLPQRPPEAIRQKGQRGELRFWLPAGLTGTAAGKIERVGGAGNRPATGRI